MWYRLKKVLKKGVVVTYTYPDIFEWNKWFAWLPVCVKDRKHVKTYRWLCVIERKYDCWNGYSYREV